MGLCAIWPIISGMHFGALGLRYALTPRSLGVWDLPSLGNFWFPKQFLVPMQPWVLLSLS